MKIGIVGNYGHDNNGDEAILQGILHQLQVYMNVSKQDIVIFSNNPDNTVARYGMTSVPLLKKTGSFASSVFQTLKSHRKVVKELDYLIIGGGGILMDMYKRDAPLYSSLAFLARQYKCQTIVYGVGAGPIQTKLGRFLIKNMTQSARLVAVRDEKSKSLIESLGINQPVHMIADPAFTLKYDGKKELTDAPLKIGVTAVPYFSKNYWPVSDESVYQEYVSGMAKNIDYLLDHHPAHIYFYSTKYPQDIDVTEDIYREMVHKDKVTIYKDNLPPDQLVNMAGEMDLLIGTRLHSLILAVAAGTPVIGVSYHPKVAAFMESTKQASFLVDIPKLSDHTRFYEILQSEMDRGWKKRQLDLFDLSDQMREEALKGVTLLKSVMEQELS
ncbi:polysaccharide pyruvyl transferase CsaB [Bacillus ectoiniformans]|uniref:polysaccharide pyruvyl transferase family protein n=1 Tax=Bacillus ectoiniformans TaxID=1494429 RepID=UPI001958BCCA|nr:polysaccharide pyruvyl transferase family protein [Bacillus ectoiniformans]MBM7649334.1 polysaccharide pyruvyl transferase CsaB [Bacillus ectoiniformans]